MNKSFTIETITPENYQNATFTPDQVADFLHEHLDRFRDSKEDIMKCLNYALGITKHRRGFILTAAEDAGTAKIFGTAVMCETGMSGYVPENLLVYLAVDASTRGRGLGKELMEKAIEQARGDIALHVEPDNPARRLYERMGFTNKYLEMRFRK